MKIVAIGGGSMKIDDEENPFSLSKTCDKIVSLAEKRCPRLLYIGFNQKADYYFGCIKKIFGERNCQCEYLRFNEFSNSKTVNSKFKRADIIFLPGGNTLEYMKMMNKFGLSERVIESANRGIVIAGISAGAIICFEFGHSDSKTKLSEEGHKIYSKVKGLGIEKGLISPHFSQSDRKNDIKRVLKTCKKDSICFGIDENCSLAFKDDNYEIITDGGNANVYKLFIRKTECVKQVLQKQGTIEELYKI